MYPIRLRVLWCWLATILLALCTAPALASNCDPSWQYQYWCCPASSGVTGNNVWQKTVPPPGYWWERCSGQAQIWRPADNWHYKYNVTITIHYTNASGTNPPCYVNGANQPTLQFALKGLGHCATSGTPTCRKSNCGVNGAYGTFCSQVTPPLCTGLVLGISYDYTANAGHRTLSSAEISADSIALYDSIKSAFCNPSTNAPPPSSPYSHVTLIQSGHPWNGIAKIIEGDDCACSLQNACCF